MNENKLFKLDIGPLLEDSPSSVSMVTICRCVYQQITRSYDSLHWTTKKPTVRYFTIHKAIAYYRIFTKLVEAVALSFRAKFLWKCEFMELIVHAVYSRSLRTCLTDKASEAGGTDESQKSTRGHF